MEDLVRSLGHLALGTRLKRLGERLHGQSSRLFEAQGISVPSSFFPLLAALDRYGAIPVGELAEALGVSQPGVTRALAKLKIAGLVKAGVVKGDGRMRVIGLTRAGRALVERTKASLWPQIERAVAEACAGLSGPLLDQLTGLESALAAEPLARRATRHVQKEKRHAKS